MSHFQTTDFIALTKHFLTEHYAKCHPECIIPYLGREVQYNGIFRNKSHYSYDELVKYLSEYHEKNIEREFVDLDCQIISQSNDTVVVEISFSLNDQSRHCMTVVYKDIDGQTKITYTHHSVTDEIPSIIENLVNTNSIAGLCCHYLDDDLTYYFVNVAFAEMLGYSKDELIKATNNKAINTINPEERKNIKDTILKYLTYGNTYQIEYRMVKKDGSLIWVMERGQKFSGQNGTELLCSFITDITSIKNAEFDLNVQKQKYSLALKDNSITILEFDVKTGRTIIDVQIESMKKIYDNYLDYIMSDRTTVFKEDRQKVYDLFTRKIDGPIEFREHIRNSNKILRKSMDATTIYDDDGEPIIVLATSKDITTEYNDKAKLEQKIQFDHLTHQLNLETGREKIKKYLNSRDPEQCCGLAVLDIDYFKTVNDNYGHLFGNTVLVTFADCLAKHLGEKDMLMRIGGDEFMIFFADTSRAYVNQICKEIIDDVRAIRFENSPVTITTSIGTIFLTAELLKEAPYERIFKSADDALYNAKKNGRNQYILYDRLIEPKKKDIFNVTVDYEDLENQVQQILESHDVADDEKKYLISSMVGQHFQVNRIARINIHELKSKYTYKKLWISSRSYRADDLDVTLQKNDFDELMNFQIENGTTVLQNDNLDYLPSIFKNVVMQGVAKTAVISQIPNGFIVYINYDFPRTWSEEDCARFGKLSQAIAKTL